MNSASLEYINIELNKNENKVTKEDQIKLSYKLIKNINRRVNITFIMIILLTIYNLILLIYILKE